MLTTNQGRRQSLATLTLLFTVFAFPCKGLAAPARPAGVSGESFCRASEAYLGAVAGYQNIRRHSAAPSCLADDVAIAKAIDSYQVIDIRKNAAQPPIENAWLMSIRELRTKSFLRDRPLLLIGQGFSRAQAVVDCSALKEAGFKQVKSSLDEPMLGSAHIRKGV